MLVVTPAAAVAATAAVTVTVVASFAFGMTY